MTSATRLLVPFLLLILAAVPAAWFQNDPLYVVRDAASPCLNFLPQPDTDVAPSDCLEPETQVTVKWGTEIWWPFPAGFPGSFGGVGVMRSAERTSRSVSGSSQALL